MIIRDKCTEKKFCAFFTYQCYYFFSKRKKYITYKPMLYKITYFSKNFCKICRCIYKKIMCGDSNTYKVFYKHRSYAVVRNEISMHVCSVCAEAIEKLFFIVYLGIESSYFPRNYIDQWANSFSRNSYRSVVPKYIGQKLFFSYIYRIFPVLTFPRILCRFLLPEYF